MTGTKLTCPDCGAEMNQHAIKVDYSMQDIAETDPDFGVVLEEVHTCPACGKTELRPAE